MSAVKLASSPAVLYGATTNGLYGGSVAVRILQARLKGQSRRFRFTVTTVATQPGVYIQQNELSSKL